MEAISENQGEGIAAISFTPIIFFTDANGQTGGAIVPFNPVEGGEANESISLQCT
ncbi:hypothetical protein D3C74_335650 [compost metagenome]